MRLPLLKFMCGSRLWFLDDARNSNGKLVYNNASDMATYSDKLYKVRAIIFSSKLIAKLNSVQPATYATTNGLIFTGKL